MHKVKLTYVDHNTKLVNYCSWWNNFRIVTKRLDLRDAMREGKILDIVYDPACRAVFETEEDSIAFKLKWF